MSMYPSYGEEMQASKHALANGPKKPSPVNIFHTPFRPEDHRRASYGHGYGGNQNAPFQMHTQASQRVVTRRIAPGSAGNNRFGNVAGVDRSNKAFHGHNYQSMEGRFANDQISIQNSMPESLDNPNGASVPNQPVMIEQQPTRDPLLGSAAHLPRNELRKLKVAGQHMRVRSQTEKSEIELTQAEAMKQGTIPSSLVIDPSPMSVNGRAVSPYAQAGMLPGRSLHMIRAGQRRSLSQHENPLIVVGVSQVAGEQRLSRQTSPTSKQAQDESLLSTFEAQSFPSDPSGQLGTGNEVPSIDEVKTTWKPASREKADEQSWPVGRENINVQSQKLKNLNVYY